MLGKLLNLSSSNKKLQTYKPESITLDIKGGDFFEIKDKNFCGMEKIYMNFIKLEVLLGNGIMRLLKEAKKLGLNLFLASPFDEAAVDFLEEMDMPAYKIASFENTSLASYKESCIHWENL